MCFQSRLRELVKSSGFSQQALSDAILAKTGQFVHQTTLGSYLRGERTAPIDAVVAIARCFDVSIDYLVDRVEMDSEYNFRIAALTDTQKSAVVALISHFEKANNDVMERFNTDDSSNEDISKLGYIYFIASPESGRIKIGFSSEPEKRLRALYTSSPFALETLKVIPGTVAQEREFHARFAHLRVHREWFTDCTELREFIVSLERKSNHEQTTGGRVGYNYKKVIDR